MHFHDSELGAQILAILPHTAAITKQSLTVRRSVLVQQQPPITRSLTEALTALGDMQSLTPHGSVSPSAPHCSALCGGAAAAGSDNTNRFAQALTALAEMQSLTPHGSVSPSVSHRSTLCVGAAAAASDNTIAGSRTDCTGRDAVADAARLRLAVGI